MIEIIIDADAQGQRLDRFLSKLLPGAKKGLLNKSIRNKNIKVNNKKAQPNLQLVKNDKIQIFFSDDTFEKFSHLDKKEKEIPQTIKRLFENPLYEDGHFLVVNKPAGILTQPDSSGKVALSDAASEIINTPGSTFRTAPLNRLDRNTTGIVIFPKDYQTQKKAARLIKEKNSQKLYQTLVKGKIDRPGSLVDKYEKDSQSNTAFLGEGEQTVKLKYSPINTFKNATLLEVNLKTGKSHQIRAQMAEAGHPIIGDPKYGDRKLNENYKINHQLLHAYNYILYNDDGSEWLNVTAPLPKEFTDIVKEGKY